MNSPNPYAPPQSHVSDVAAADASDGIDQLPVSSRWKIKFFIIAKAGGPKLPAIGKLSFNERMKINFSVIAFLFGPFYYLVKGMWRKAITLFAACAVVLFVLTLALELAGLGRLANALGYACGAVFAVRANIDFYKKMVLKDNGWW